MKIKKEFVLRNIGGDLLLVPTGKTALNLNGMITLNEVGGAIWNMLPEVSGEEEIAERILAEYDADPEEVRKDVSDFLEKFRELDII